MDVAVRAEGLTKRYGKRAALLDFDLAVPAGSVCGLLGPNGAGKTTAVRIMSTLLRPDGGRAIVAGYDVVADAAQARFRIGLAGQSAAVDELLTGRANLVMFARMYHLSRALARTRAEQLLERFHLIEAADRRVKTYSGGMRRRLDLAASLIVAPPVLFLDEPTTGIDPGNRLEIWEMISELVAEGTTVLLTTQYLEEADRLANQIVVLDQGRIVAAGTPLELKSALGGQSVDVVLEHRHQLAAAVEALRSVGPTPPRPEPEQARIRILTDDGVGALVRSAHALADAGIDVADLGLRRPTLDEVFLHLTSGHPATTEKVPTGKNPSTVQEVSR